MRLAYSTLACPQWTLEEAAEAALASGYEGLEIRLIDGRLVRPDLTGPERRRVRDACRAAGLAVVAVDSGVRIGLSDPAERAAQVEAGLAFAETAAFWGAPLVRVFGQPSEGAPEADVLDAAAATLNALAEGTRGSGVAFALETHDFFAGAARVRQALDRAPGARALWDTLHPCRVGETTAQTLALLGDRLAHVHVKDGRPRPEGGEHWQLLPLGEGAVPMREILDSLRAAGYGSWLSVEWEKFWHPTIAEPEVALPLHAERLRELLRS
ncbi:MAG TPA: sugar phosphate isomerase/epimerase family protein [Deinococcales bacterium]|nr:sugar phosphate isomerase/epimerase family protein [Deinococcales bacterium]